MAGVHALLRFCIALCLIWVGTGEARTAPTQGTHVSLPSLPFPEHSQAKTYTSPTLSYAHAKATMASSTVTMQQDTRIALVTGADRGLGLEYCKQLANQGYLVVGTAKDAVNASELNDLAKESQNKIFVQQLDQTKEDEIKNLTEALRTRNYRLE